MSAPSEAHKVLKGLDDFLFLQNDTNNVLSQISGAVRLSDEQVQGWARELQSRVDFCRGFNGDYYLFVAPNSHCVYSELLPEGCHVSAERIACQLLQASSRTFYPLDALNKAKQTGLLYRKTDTHWNSLGCAQAWNAFSDFANLGYKIDCSSIEQVKIIGDLGCKLTPPQPSLTPVVKIEHGSSMVWNNGLNNRGRMKIFRNSRRDLKRCVLFGDSFSNIHIDYIAEYFSDLYFLHTPFFSTSILEELQPDVVINCNIERFFAGPTKTVRDVVNNQFLYLMLFGKYDKASLNGFASCPYNSLYSQDVFELMQSMSNLYVKLLDFYGRPTLVECFQRFDADCQEGRFESVFAQFPSSYLLFRKSRLLMRDGRHAEAVQAIRQAIELDPGIALYHLELAALHPAMSDAEIHQEALRKARELDPDCQLFRGIS